MMKLYTDLRDEAYRQIIDLAMRNSDFFVLSDKNDAGAPQ